MNFEELMELEEKVKEYRDRFYDIRKRFNEAKKEFLNSTLNIEDYLRMKISEEEEFEEYVGLKIDKCEKERKRRILEERRKRLRDEIEENQTVQTVICTRSGYGYFKKCIYPVVGWNNGIQISRIDRDGDCRVCTFYNIENEITDIEDEATGVEKEQKCQSPIFRYYSKLHYTRY